MCGAARGSRPLPRRTRASRAARLRSSIIPSVGTRRARVSFRQDGSSRARVRRTGHWGRAPRARIWSGTRATISRGVAAPGSPPPPLRPAVGASRAKTTLSRSRAARARAAAPRAALTGEEREQRQRKGRREAAPHRARRRIELAQAEGLDRVGVAAAVGPRHCATRATGFELDLGGRDGSVERKEWAPERVTAVCAPPRRELERCGRRCRACRSTRR